MTQWSTALDRYLHSLDTSRYEERRQAESLRRQTSVFFGSILFSLREDLPLKRCCRPVLVDLSNATKILVYVRIDEARTVDLSVIQRGYQANQQDTGSGLRSHAKRVRYEGIECILIELSK